MHILSASPNFCYAGMLYDQLDDKEFEQYVQILFVRPCLANRPTLGSAGEILLVRWHDGNYQNRLTGVIHQVTQASRTTRDEHEEELILQRTAVLASERMLRVQLDPKRLVKRAIVVFDGPPVAVEHQYVYRVEPTELQVGPDAATHGFELSADDTTGCPGRTGLFEWYDLGDIPFSEMPADDKIWYPHALSFDTARDSLPSDRQSGSLIKGEFHFGGVDERTIKSYALWT
eukprot:GHVS01027912.1.p1 GENE.GHVS01027912.1~~GHVS01027912.1.p1  ORF type:complete len:231 (-),score=27.81 GHVS01027912.1:152-844(-)